jgi:unsaturated rhamnogalacturonyl hydrolase
MLSQYFNAYAACYTAYKQGAWCYEDGCIYRGLEMLDSVDPQGPWLAHLRRLIDKQVAADGTLLGYDIEEFNIDNILSGRLLFGLAARTGDARYMKAAGKLAEQLARHPRTESGNYWHKLRYPHQVWLDGLYMSLPFQIEFGKHIGSPELIGDAVGQFVAALNLTHDPTTGLYMHGYDESRQQRWADPETGRSPTLWTRALGWMAMAMVDSIELIGPAAAEASGLTKATSEFAAGIRTHQRDDGRWHQVTDMPDLEGNYPEASGTAMLAYFFLAGARIGIPECDTQTGNRALDGLLQHSLRKDEKGQLALYDVCHVAGLGGFDGNYRDGTPGYYLSEPLAPDDAKGVGPLMMAIVERMRAEAAGKTEIAQSA